MFDPPSSDRRRQGSDSGGGILDYHTSDPPSRTHDQAAQRREEPSSPASTPVNPAPVAVSATTCLVRNAEPRHPQKEPMKFLSHPVPGPALLALVALPALAGCSSAPLQRATAEFVGPATWMEGGHAMVNPVALTTNRAPIYPIPLRRSRLEGLVNVDAVIDATGRVLLPSVADSTDQGFNKSTLEAVRDWTFQPATRDGVPIAMAVTLPVSYVMER